MIVCRVLTSVVDKFRPHAIVCQCGADGLYGDPMDSFNLTPRSLCACVEHLQQLRLPLLLLGGGEKVLCVSADEIVPCTFSALK